MTKRVFVVQNQHKMAVDGHLEPKFDLSSAESFGELTYLLSPTARAFKPESVIRELTSKLADYDATNDSLLLIGNPALIGFAVAIASSCTITGRLRLLQWDGRRAAYAEILTELRPKRTFLDPPPNPRPTLAINPPIELDLDPKIPRIVRACKVEDVGIQAMSAKKRKP